MKVSDAIQHRKSVRAFLDKPVPEEIIREVLELAKRAPSSSNTQPWHIAVVSGQTKDKITADVAKVAVESKIAGRELSHAGADIDPPYIDRMRHCGKRLYEAAGVPRGDKQARAKQAFRNWQFFDAPHAMFFSMPRCVGHAYIVDIGCLLQSIMLLLTERGIASCAQGALSNYHDITRKHANIPEENLIVCGLSFGYEDTEAPENHLNLPRAELEDFVSFSD